MTSFTKSLIQTSINNFLLMIINFGTGIIVARLLGPQGRGELAAIQNWAAIFTTLSLLGMAESVVYFSAKSPKQTGIYISTGLLIALTSGLISVVIGRLIMPFLLAAQSPEIISAGRNYLFMVLLFTLLIIPTQSFRGRNEIAIWNILRSTQTITWAIVLTFAYFLKQPSPIWISKEYIVITLFFTLFIFIVIYIKIPGPFLPNLKAGKEMLKFGLPAFGGVIPQLLNLRLDQMLMAIFLSPNYLGLYVVAVSWSGALAPMFNAIGSITFPDMAASLATSEKQVKLIRASHLGIILVIFLGPTVSLLTPLAIPILFGTAYNPSVPTAIILIFAACFAGMNSILEESAKGLGHPKIVLFAESCGLIVTIIFLLIFIKPMNILGAGLASLLGYTATYISLLFQICRFLNCRVSDLVIPRFDDLLPLIQRVRFLVNSLK